MDTGQSYCPTCLSVVECAVPPIMHFGVLDLGSLQSIKIRSKTCVICRAIVDLLEADGPDSFSGNVELRTHPDGDHVAYTTIHFTNTDYGDSDETGTNDEDRNSNSAYDFTNDGNDNFDSENAHGVESEDFDYDGEGTHLCHYKYSTSESEDGQSFPWHIRKHDPLADEHEFLYDWDCVLLPLTATTSGQPSARLLSDSSVDTRRIKLWLEYCDNNHSASCSTTSLGENSLSQRLILVDVTQKCLVLATEPVDYYALSYVWGDPNTVFKTTSQNFALLQQPGQLDPNRSSSALPRTIADAIRLVEILGGKFIWIDSLCIIQDEETVKSAYIANMGSIYRNAYCTIIACLGDNAHCGLEGVEESLPRRVIQRVLRFPNFPMVTNGRSSVSKAVDVSVWNSRAWTFQEFILSRRSLYFTRGMIHFICQKAQWEEELADDPPSGARNTSYLTLGDPFRDVTWPNLHSWTQKLGFYMVRELTDENDALVAFAGLEEIFSVGFPSGFTKGLPEFFFDAALLWRVRSPLKRNQGTDQNLPSWSWCGWRLTTAEDRYLMFKNVLHNGQDYMRSQPGFAHQELLAKYRLQPLAKWYKVDVEGNRETIRNDYFVWRCLRESQSIQGWQTRFDEDTCEMYFTHPLIEDCTFWWPLPLNTGTRQLKPRISDPQYLECVSSHAYCSLDVLPGSTDTDDGLKRLVCDSYGKCIGFLHLNEASPIPEGSAELLALSYGTMQSSKSRFYHIEDKDFLDVSISTTPLYEYYNVMWIERDGQYCYRKAIGRVAKAAWEQQDLKQITVKLR